MPIAENLQDLPKTRPQGNEPDAHPRFAPVLAQSWMDLFGDDTVRPKADAASRFRASDAGSCSRRLGYDLIEGVTERTDPMTIADHWRLGIGKAVHEWLQEALVAAYPDAEPEKISLLLDGLMSGHGDLFIPALGTEIEAKTINGFGFKKAVGARGPAEGPRYSAIIQGALNALSHDAHELVILYLSLELLSPREAAKMKASEIGRFCAEWTYPREVFEPIALAELARLQLIAADVDAGVLPERIIPDPEIDEGAVITNPAKGEWRVEMAGLITGTGSTWHCNYCPWQTRCTADAEKGQ